MGNNWSHFEDITVDQRLILDAPADRVRLFDVGPQPPTAPEEPCATATPQQLEDHEMAVARYAAAMLTYKRERAEWVEKYKGPVEYELDATSANEFVQRDGLRWVRALPPGVESGPHRGANRIRLGI